MARGTFIQTGRVEKSEGMPKCSHFVAQPCSIDELETHLYTHEGDGDILDIVDAAGLAVVLVDGREAKTDCR